MNRFLAALLCLFLGVLLPCSLRAQSLYTSWENSMTGWIDQSAAKFSYSYSTATGVTEGVYSLKCTAAANPGWSSLISTDAAAVRTALLNRSSVNLSVYTESASATFANVTIAVNGNAGSWRQLTTKTVTLNGATELQWDLSAADQTYITGSTGWFQFWIIVQTDAPITYYLDNLRFTAAGVAPTVTGNPSATSVPVGGTATFTAAGTGTAPLVYQWYANGNKLTGYTSATLSLPCVMPEDAGTYHCVIGNAVGSASTSTATLTVTAATNTGSAAISIDAGQIVSTVDDKMFGFNAAVWDSRLDDGTTLALLKANDTRVLRFPAGSGSDEYNWETGKSTSVSTGEVTTWSITFDEFAEIAVGLKAEVYLTANYGTGTAEHAAAWVKYSNVTKGYGFKYWEVGNENYGSWEPDNRDTRGGKKWDPVTYAQQYKLYQAAMKAEDPTIKVGAVVEVGEDFLDSKSPAGQYVTNPRTGVQHKGWTPVVLATLKSLGCTPDFVILHRYDQQPGAESDAYLLQSSKEWANSAAGLRQMLSDYLGTGHESVELHVTENNSVTWRPGKQIVSLVNGLFLADSIGNLMQTEFRSCVWWDLRNGQSATYTDGTGTYPVNLSSSLYGWRQYGDYGILTDKDEAYPVYHVSKLLSYFARGGDSVVKATSDNTLLTTYAVKRKNGTLCLLVINKSPAATLTGNFTVNGFTPTTNAPIYSYGVAQDRAAQLGIDGQGLVVGSLRGLGSSFSASFLPYSVSVIPLYPAGGSSRLVNLSVRGTSGLNEKALIPGFYVGGAGTSGSLPLLARVDGPSLAPLGVPLASLLLDPTIEVNSTDSNNVVTQIGSNDDWGGSDAMRDLFTATGAYDYGASTADAALTFSASAGPGYTFYTRGKDNATGVVLAELFDAVESPEPTTPRLTNISGRAHVGVGAEELIAGFIIEGTKPKTVLIRVWGETLGQPLFGFGLNAVLMSPRLDLHNYRYGNDEIIKSNSGWGGSTEIKVATGSGYPFVSDSSKDCAFIVTLPPGSYTAVVKGISNATGLALVEVNEVE